jgi:Ca2+/H+ antiporter, TMEM165/GDT1 family
MKRSKFPRFILFLLFIFAVLVPLGFIIMALWNNILAVIFPIAMINFWQALGLFLLSRILFGGFPGKPGWAGRRHNRREMEDMRSKWFNMSPEERQHFKQNLKSRFRGCQQTPATESPASEQSPV